MSDMDILNQMIKDSAKILPTSHYSKTKIELVEPQDTRSAVSIYGVPDNVIVIKVDTFPPPDSVFAGKRGECKRADYVIVSNTEERKVIVYIEMKRTKGSREEIVQQLKGAKCFINYCKEIGRVFWQERNFLKDYQHCFVSIGHTSIPKRRTRITRKNGKHDQPDKMLKIDWPHHLQFNHLAGA